jgi:hypothetical protein
MTADMIPATLSGRRALLYLVAVLFGATTTLFDRYRNRVGIIRKVGVRGCGESSRRNVY